MHVTHLPLKGHYISPHQLHQISYGKLLVFHALEVLDDMPKRSQTVLIFWSSGTWFLLWWLVLREDPGYLKTCTEVSVAYIVIDNMRKTVSHIFSFCLEMSRRSVI